MSVRDLIIVGAGPSGLSAAIAAKQHGLDYQVLEQGVLVNSIYRFPPQMVFFTTPELLEIGGLPFVSPYEKPTRAEALKYYRKVVDTYDLQIAFAEAHPRAAVVAPQLRNPDGTLQRSVRGFPTLWRIATEYLFVRKLAPSSAALNAFYAGDFAHDVPREAEWIMGAVWLVRRAAVDEVGAADDSFFLFSEETDWAYRFRRAGWEVWFDPAAVATHVYGGAHGGRMLAENVRSQLRYLEKHRGTRYARRARRILVVGLLLRRRFDVIRAL